MGEYEYSNDICFKMIFAKTFASCVMSLCNVTEQIE